MAKTSAAKRLQLLVNDLKNEAIQSDRRLRQAFARVFDIDEREKAQLAKAYTDLLGLMEEVRGEIEGLHGPVSEDPDIEEQRQARLAPIDRLYDIFSDNSIHSKVEILNNIDAALLEGLRHVAAAVQGATREELVEKDVLGNWRIKILELAQEVQNDPDLDRDFAFLIYMKLGEIDRAIVQYKVTGIKGLARAVEQTCGAMVTRPSWFGRAVKKSKSFVKTIVLLNGLSDVVQKAAHMDYFRLPPVMEEVCNPAIHSGDGNDGTSPTAVVHELPLPSKDEIEIEEQP